MSKATTTVAFFDFDGTLTAGDTLMPFLKFVVGRPKYYAKLFLISPVLVAYFAKLIPNDVAKEIVLKQYLAGYNIDELCALGKRFSEEVIPHMLRPEGMERLRWHQNQGHDCVLVSASMDVYLDSWSNNNGFKAAITTQLQNVAGVVNGKILNENCYGDEKVRQIKLWLNGRKTLKTYAYGDTSGDLPMLLAVNSGWMLKGNFKIKLWEEVI
jgi:phosphatidylglycerophosphatase C